VPAFVPTRQLAGRPARKRSTPRIDVIIQRVKRSRDDGLSVLPSNSVLAVVAIAAGRRGVARVASEILIHFGFTTIEPRDRIADGANELRNTTRAADNIE